MAWTDERMDDLVERVDAGFARVDGDIRDLRVEMHSGLAGVRAEMHSGLAGVRAEMHSGFADLRTEIGELRSMMFRFGIAMFGLIASLMAAIVAGTFAG